MSQGQQYLDRRSNDAEITSDDEDTQDVQENDASSFYGGVRNAFNAGRAAVEVHPSDEPQWTQDTIDSKSPQVRWIAALNAKRNAIGEVQGNDNPFTMGEYEDEVGADLPGIDSEVMDEGVIDLLESAGYDDADELRGLHVPVVNGDPIPVMVNSEDALNEALALLAEIPDEPEAVGQPEPETNPYEEAADALDVDVSEVEAAVETWGCPTEVTVGDIRSWVGTKGDRRITDEGEAQALLAIEQITENRGTAIDALESRINAIKRRSDTDISGSGEGAYLGENGGSEQDEQSGDNSDDGEVHRDDGVSVSVTVDIPEDASRGTRLKEAGNLMEMGYTEEQAMEKVGL